MPAWRRATLSSSNAIGVQHSEIQGPVRADGAGTEREEQGIATSGRRLDGARAFYEEVLGLTRGLAAPNGVWTEYDLPGSLASVDRETIEPPRASDPLEVPWSASGRVVGRVP